MLFRSCGQGIIDYCIYDTGEIIPEFIKKYNLEGQDIVEQDVEKVKGIKFLQRNLSMVDKEFIRHDSNLVATSIIELICDDLKYQDKQNEPQYLMLNTKLQEEKRINKKKKSMARKNKNGKKVNEKQIRGKSKFSNKYSERIASIRNADEKARIKTENVKRKTENMKKRTSKSSEETEIINSKRKTPKTKSELKEEMLKKLNDSTYNK